MSQDPRIEAAAKALLSFDTSTPLDDVPGPVGRDVYRRATAALAAADKAATITTVEGLDALPVGSVAMGWAFNGSTPYLRCLTMHGRLVWGCVGQSDLFTSADLLKDGFKARVIHWGQADAPDKWININGMQGTVCGVCEDPTESEPCAEHQPDAYKRCTE